MEEGGVHPETKRRRCFRKEGTASPQLQRPGNADWETAGTCSHGGVTGDPQESRFGGVPGTESHSKGPKGKLEVRNWK